LTTSRSWRASTTARMPSSCPGRIALTQKLSVLVLIVIDRWPGNDHPDRFLRPGVQDPHLRRRAGGPPAHRYHVGPAGRYRGGAGRDAETELGAAAVNDLTDEERELVKGMPAAVAEGFINARRAVSARNPWDEMVERGAKLQSDLWGGKR